MQPYHTERQEGSIHKKKLYNAKQKELSYIKGVIRAINNGNYKRAKGLFDDYKDNYPNSKIWKKSKSDNLVSQLEGIIESKQNVTVVLTNKEIIVTSKQ